MMFEYSQIENDINNIKKQKKTIKNEYHKVLERLDGKFAEMKKLTNSDDKVTLEKEEQKQEFIIREKHIKGKNLIRFTKSAERSSKK